VAARSSAVCQLATLSTPDTKNICASHMRMPKSMKGHTVMRASRNNAACVFTLRAIQTESFSDVRACGRAAIVSWDMAPPSSLISERTFAARAVPPHSTGSSRRTAGF